MDNLLPDENLLITGLFKNYTQFIKIRILLSFFLFWPLQTRMDTRKRVVLLIFLRKKAKNGENFLPFLFLVSKTLIVTRKQRSFLVTACIDKRQNKKLRNRRRGNGRRNRISPPWISMDGCIGRQTPRTSLREGV